MENALTQYIESEGWIIECENPLEIRHENGAFATYQAAQIVINQLTVEFNALKNNTNDINPRLLLVKQLQTVYHQVDAIMQAAYEQCLKNEQEIKEYGYAVSSTDPWDAVYHLIFCPEISRQVFKKFEQLNMDLNYYDPDTSYQEDVEAFVNAFKYKMESLSFLNTLIE